jgi:hypothetical protein
MWLVALHHTEIGRELAVLRVVVSFATESVLGCLPSDTFHVEVVGELAAEFQKMEDQCYQIEQPTARICDLLLGPLPSQARMADHLDQADRQLGVELATRWEADAELEALRISAAWVQDLVLGGVNGTSSLAASMSMTAELLEGRIDIGAANGVHWGSHSALVAAVLHFLELKTELEVLGSGHNMD